MRSHAALCRFVQFTRIGQTATYFGTTDVVFRGNGQTKCNNSYHALTYSPESDKQHHASTPRMSYSGETDSQEGNAALCMSDSGETDNQTGGTHVGMSYSPESDILDGGISAAEEDARICARHPPRISLDIRATRISCTHRTTSHVAQRRTSRIIRQNTLRNAHTSCVTHPHVPTRAITRHAVRLHARSTSRITRRSASRIRPGKLTRGQVRASDPAR